MTEYLTTEVMDQNIHRDFTKPDQFTDIVIVVEGTKLYAHRMLLAEWSGVWRRLFVSEMSGDESDPVEFPLDDEKLAEITELLQCIYSTQTPITDENVKFLLKLSEEYEMPNIKTRCEEYLMNNSNSLETLILAERYGLKHLYRTCMESVKTRTLEEIQRSPDFKELSQETVIKLYKEKLDMMRDYANDLKVNEKKLKQQNDQLAAEKDGMLHVFQNIPKVWEEPSKRCYKHMTEEKFDYTCRDCHEKIQREVRRLCHDGQHMRKFYTLNNTKT